MQKNVHSLQDMGERILEGFFYAPNQGDFSLIPKLYTAHSCIHTSEGEKRGPASVIEIFRKWQDSYPSFTIEPLLMQQESDVLVVHWRFQGSVDHSIKGLSTIKEDVAIYGYICFRCADDHVVEHWARVDYRPLSERTGNEKLTLSDQLE